MAPRASLASVVAAALLAGTAAARSRVRGGDAGERPRGGAMAHALPRAGAPLAPPDGSEAAYLAPAGGCLVPRTLVGGGGGGGRISGESARARARA